MQLILDRELANSYSSASQQARVLTEAWVSKSAFCPNCGQNKINQFANNKPVADFHCLNCNEEYELKSKKNTMGKKIIDGAYETMIGRLHENNNPNFFFLNYNLTSLEVFNFIVIPKHFFTPEIIEKRKPLAPTARRAGWVGCNIILDGIPDSGKIFYVKNGEVLPKKSILDSWQKTLFLRKQTKVSSKGWLIDVMRCVEKIGKKEFTLNEMYSFVDELAIIHPNNNHIKNKIRQQLQILRDKGYLKFLSDGLYRLNS